MYTPKDGETLKFMYTKQSQQRFTKFNYGVTRTIMKANHFEPALRPNYQRSVADPALILCLNRVSIICLQLFMCHEVSHIILEYPFQQKPILKCPMINASQGIGCDGDWDIHSGHLTTFRLSREGKQEIRPMCERVVYVRAKRRKPFKKLEDVKRDIKFFAWLLKKHEEFKT